VKKDSIAEYQRLYKFDARKLMALCYKMNRAIIFLISLHCFRVCGAGHSQLPALRGRASKHGGRPNVSALVPETSLQPRAVGV
jgi:hypothetical protein